MRNSWDHLAQEVLISTPRRFGKTISVSMFAAAMLVAAPQVEISIYSTCKRISQKLLRNVVKFVNEICDHSLVSQGLRVLRQNMEEIVLQGPDGRADVRIVNSYPSKVSLCLHIKSPYNSRLKGQVSPETRTISTTRVACAPASTHAAESAHGSPWQLLVRKLRVLGGPGMAPQRPRGVGDGAGR